MLSAELFSLCELSIGIQINCTHNNLNQMAHKLLFFSFSVLCLCVMWGEHWIYNYIYCSLWWFHFHIKIENLLKNLSLHCDLLQRNEIVEPFTISIKLKIEPLKWMCAAKVNLDCSRFAICVLLVLVWLQNEYSYFNKLIFRRRPLH